MSVGGLPLPVLPATRGGCAEGPRPCPHATCRYWLDHADASCALDVADAGGAGTKEVARLLGMTKQGVQGVVERALRKLRPRLDEQGWREWLAYLDQSGNDDARYPAPVEIVPSTILALGRPLWKARRRKPGREAKLIALLTEHGPLHRTRLIELTGRSASWVDFGLECLRAKGLVAPPLPNGQRDGVARLVTPDPLADQAQDADHGPAR